MLVCAKETKSEGDENSLLSGEGPGQNSTPLSRRCESLVLALSSRHIHQGLRVILKPEQNKSGSRRSLAAASCHSALVFQTSLSVQRFLLPMPQRLVQGLLSPSVLKAFQPDAVSSIQE